MNQTYERIAVLEAEVARLTKKCEWQPIETAPRDVPVLGWFPLTGERAKTYVMHWNDDSYAKNPRPLWDVHGWIWPRSALRACQPTHWMPLPSAPESN